MRLGVMWHLAMVIGLMTGAAGSSLAQDEFDIRWNVSEGNWTVDENWADATGQTAFAPAADFEEGAFIGNGGTAIADSATVDVFNLSIPNGAVDIRQGGSLNVVGTGQFARDVSVGAQGNLILTGNGSLDLSQGLANSGLIHLGSAAASLNVGGNLSHRGALQLDIGADGSTPSITGGGAATLSGSVFANFAGGTALAFGDSFQFLSGASSVQNNSPAVTLPNNFPLEKGLALQVVSTSNTASLTVGNLPVLTLNRATGAASISNVVGGALSLTAYDIRSNLELLNPATWSSLNSQGLTDWTVANPRTSELAELNFSGVGTLEVGDSLSLGNAYNGGPTNPRDEDVTFQFTTPDGRILDGIVEYEGPANDLVLNIDPESGDATLQNFSAFIDPIDLTGYSISSTSGSLLPDSLNSFVDSGLAGDGWTEANPQATAISELNLTSSKVFSTGTAISLGNIFDVAAGVRDVQLQFSTPDALFTGTVQYGPGGGGGPTPGDCNGDGVVNADDLACVQSIADRDIVLAAIPTLAGDLDGNGAVAFPDFLTLSNNFGQAVKDYTKGDIDLNGAIAFPDFLTLSNNFGKTPGAAAAAVPEPASGVLGLLAVVGLLAAGRKRVNGRVLAACMVVCVLGVATVNDVLAIPFDGRFIKVDATGPTGTIDTAEEARLIVKGNPDGAVFSEEVLGTVQVLDLAGDAGSFTVNTPYLNGVNDSTQDDFLQVMEGVIEIPAGDWTIGFSSDDGGYLRMPAISFGATFNENGTTTAGDGEILYNGTRGFSWTTGQFTVPAGGIRTDFEALFFERGGGDGLEVALFNGTTDTTDAAIVAAEWTLVEDGALGWTIIDLPKTPGDFNYDGSIDLVDAGILTENYGTGTTFDQGDNNLDGRIDLVDFTEFRAIFNGQGAAAAAVPEPAGLVLFSLAGALLLGVRRRRA